jgi:hypothetical protein
MGIITFFRNASPVKLIILCLLIGLGSIFLEKPFPNIFLLLRLFVFILFIYSVVKFFKSK